MMSLETIKALEDMAAKRAAQKNLVPYVPFDENEIRSYGKDGVRFPFPSLGSHRPEGWDLVGDYLCDSSGLGADDEPALTSGQLRLKLLVDYAKDETYGYAIISEGQFQIVLGVFEKEKQE